MSASVRRSSAERSQEQNALCRASVAPSRLSTFSTSASMGKRRPTTCRIAGWVMVCSVEEEFVQSVRANEQNATKGEGASERLGTLQMVARHLARHVRTPE